MSSLDFGRFDRFEREVSENRAEMLWEFLE